MAEYKLTYYNLMGLAEPIRYMFAVAGVKYEDIRIPREEGDQGLPEEIKEKLPWGVLPTLEFNGKTLSHSGAISRYIAKKLHFSGADDFESAQIDEIIDALVEIGKEWSSLRTEQDLKKKGEIMKKIKDVSNVKLMEKLNKMLEENSGKWLVGSKLSLADLVFAHYVTLMSDRSKIDLVKGFPALENHIKNVYVIPQIKEWIDKRPKTDL